MFNTIQIMFYFWAKGKINSVDTPNCQKVMNVMIKFFKLFYVQQKFKEIKAFFWHDETTEQAQVYIRQYKDDISELEKKYADSEKSYEQHMQDMRMINTKLESISSGSYQQYKQEQEARQNSESSTHAGSKDGTQQQQYAAKSEEFWEDCQYNN